LVTINKLPTKNSSDSLIEELVEMELTPLDGDEHVDILNLLKAAHDEFHVEEKRIIKSKR